MQIDRQIKTVSLSKATAREDLGGAADEVARADGIATPDLLDYVATFSDDFAGLAMRSQLPRLSLLLDMVSAEAKRERARQPTRE